MTLFCGMQFKRACVLGVDSDVLAMKETRVDSGVLTIGGLTETCFTFM